MKTVQEHFLHATNVTCETEALRNCVLASFRRNNIYLSGAENARRWRLRQDLKARLTALGDIYAHGSVSETEHEANIVGLADALSAEHGDILVNRRFKIGTSQKALSASFRVVEAAARPSERDRRVHRPAGGYRVPLRPALRRLETGAGERSVHS